MSVLQSELCVFVCLDAGGAPGGVRGAGPVCCYDSWEAEPRGDEFEPTGEAVQPAGKSEHGRTPVGSEERRVRMLGGF